MKRFILLSSMLLLLFTACYTSNNNDRSDSDENSAINTKVGYGTNLNAADGSEADGDTSIVSNGRVEPAKVLQGAGYNIDSTAFWTAPTLEESLLLITAKGNNVVEIWQYPFETELDPFPTNTNVNGIAVDQEGNLLFLALPGSKEVNVYSLPDLTPISSFGNGIIGFGENNLALFHPEGG